MERHEVERPEARVQQLCLPPHLHDAPRFRNGEEPLQHAAGRPPNAPWVASIQTTYFLRHQGTARSLIVDSVPVYDPRGYLTRLRDTIGDYPASLSNRLVEDFVRRLRVKLTWYTDRWIPTNKVSFVLAIQDILYFIAAAHYAKNKRLMPTLGLTRYHRGLPTLKLDFRRVLDDFLAVDKKFGRENKSVLLQRIVDRLTAG